MTRLLFLMLFFLGIGLNSVAKTPTESSDTLFIVCPGGSYCWLDIKNEGTPTVEALKARGYDAMVLRYRVSGIFAHVTHSRLLFRGNQYPDALEDIKEAIQEGRKTHRVVGVIGFSAGGHLALLSAMESNPDFVAAIYPVVTMRKPYVHKRSRRGLLGEYRKYNKSMQDSLSLERHAERIKAPVFLLNCKDDPVVDYHHSVLMDAALTAAHKNHLYIQYEEGGHGFGISKHHWLDDFLSWLCKI